MKRNRLLLAAGAIVAAAVIVVVLLVAISPGTKSQTTSPLPTVARSAFGGVPQHGDTLGRPSAAVTITVFEDPQCPFCRQWSLDTLPTLVDRYVRTGRVKLVYRGIEVIGPQSTQALRAIYAAGAQNKLWNLADELYRRQGAENSSWITDAVIRDAAAVAGAKPDRVLALSSSVAVNDALAQATRDAHFGQVNGTPTFVIERPPGLPQQLALQALDPATFTAALDAALQ